MSDDSPVLTTEVIEKLKLKVAALADGNCDNSTLRAAQRIAEPQFGGKAANVYDVLPQIAEDVRHGKDAKIDVNRDGEVKLAELTAAMVAAAQIAKREGIKLEEVPIEEIAKLTPEICKKLQPGAESSCHR